MYVNDLPRYEILSEEAMAVLDGGWRRIVSELGVEFALPEARGAFPRGRPAHARARRSSSTPTSCSSRWQRRRATSSCRPATPSTRFTSATTTWPSRASTGRRSCARAMCAATPRWPTSRTSCGSRSPSPSSTRRAAPSSSPTTDRSTRATSTWCYALQTLSDKPVHGLGDLGRERARHRGDGRDPVRRPGAAGRGAGVDLADQLQLAAALGRPHAQRDARVQPRPPGRGGHALPAHGRHVAGVDPGHARAADGRGALGHRPHPAREPGLPGGVRLVPVEHRHAVGLAQLRHSRVGDRPALHGPDRAQLRPALAQRRRPQRQPDHRRPGRLRGADDDAADLPGRGRTS